MGALSHVSIKRRRLASDCLTCLINRVQFQLSDASAALVASVQIQPMLLDELREAQQIDSFVQQVRGRIQCDPYYRIDDTGLARY